MSHLNPAELQEFVRIFATTNLTFYATVATPLSPICPNTSPVQGSPEEGSAMLRSLAMLMLCQAAGEVIHGVTRVPVPGTVTGMGLLLALLCLHHRWTGDELPLPAAEPLLSYLSLFFVPPGVVALMSAGRFAPVAPAVISGLLGSTVLTLLVAGRLVQALLAWSERRRGLSYTHFR